MGGSLVFRLLPPSACSVTVVARSLATGSAVFGRWLGQERLQTRLPFRGIGSEITVHCKSFDMSFQDPSV